MSFFSKKTLFSALALLSPSLLLADMQWKGSCYVLSRDSQSWSRTQEMMCVKRLDNSGVQINLITKNMGSGNLVASFNYEQMPSIPEIQVYRVGNPSNSIFNELEITIEGILRNYDIGICKIGKQQFYCKPASYN